jgi:cytochrome c oxidase assembly protein subunit 15
MVTLTILAGGLTAGLHAGLSYNTFPLMDGRLVPGGYAVLRPLIRNLTENVAAVQFDHRLLATLTLVAAAATAAVGLTARPSRLAALALAALLGAAATQYVLGIATLLLVAPAALASLHQAAAMLLLTAALVLLHATRPVPAGRRTRQ